MSALASPSARKPSRRWSRRRVRRAACGQRRMRTAAAPFQLRWSMLVSVIRKPRGALQANYRAVQAVAQEGVGELGMRGTGVDADPQVDVAFADLRAGTCRRRAGGPAVCGCVPLTTTSVENSTRGSASKPPQQPKRHNTQAVQQCPEAGRAGCFWYVFVAPAQARMIGESPVVQRQCLQAPASAPQRKIENVGRVCSKSLIENTLSL